MAKLLSIVEASEILNVSPNTLRKWILQKRIAYIKVGTLVRFREEDIQKIMTEGVK